MNNANTESALNDAVLALGAEGFVSTRIAGLHQYTLPGLCSVSLYTNGRACVVDHTTDTRIEEPSWASALRRVGVAL